MIVTLCTNQIDEIISVIIYHLTGAVQNVSPFTKLPTLFNILISFIESIHFSLIHYSSMDMLVLMCKLTANIDTINI